MARNLCCPKFEQVPLYKIEDKADFDSQNLGMIDLKHFIIIL
jgi:hypothetical protein